MAKLIPEVAAIIRGDRLPIERDIEPHPRSESADSFNGSFEDTTSLCSVSSIGSFQEAEFRLASVATRLDSLYKLAARVRNPRSRPQRPTKDLYKHVSENQRIEYMHSQDNIEISLVAYVQQHQLLEYFTKEQLRELGFSQEQLVQQYASMNYWLVRRTGIANARRKQQFVYWKKHTELLERDLTEVPLPVVLKEPAGVVLQPQQPMSCAIRSPPSGSMATSATKLDLSMSGLDDMKSVISNHSRISTVYSPKGNELAWPPAPSHLAGSKYFSCPYCGTLCPAKYLSIDEWR
jgi:hypothetical protein